MPTWTAFSQYYEKIDTEAPSTCGFGMDGSRAEMIFHCNRLQLSGFIENILGKTAINPNGSLNRDLPLCHPEFNWLYATNFAVQGVGLAGQIEAETSSQSVQDGLYRNMPETVAIYEKYRIKVQFENRPYLMINDAQMVDLAKQKKSYLQGGAVQNFTDFAEYARFVRVSRPQAKPELLAANNGNWYLHSPDLANSPQPINQVAGAGPQIKQIKNRVDIKWFFLPYVMITNRNWQKAYGRINFNDGDFFGFPDGSLLFDNISIDDYPGPKPTTVPDLNDLNASIYANRYCDVTFHFEHFEVPAEAAAAEPVGFADPSIIPRHHNTSPHSGLMKYCFTGNSDTIATAKPPYYAFNMKQLFIYSAN